MFLCIIFSFSGLSQDGIFSSPIWNYDSLSLNQKQSLDKIRNQDSYVADYFIKIKNLTASQFNGYLDLELPGLSDSLVTFKASNVEYYSEADYIWEGMFISEDNTNNEEIDGYIILMSKNGKRFGYVRVDSINFDIVDLEDGKNVLVRTTVENSSEICGTDEDTNKNSFPSSRLTTKYCPVRLLVLYTPAAAVDGGIFDPETAATLGFQLLKNSLSNSQIYSSDLNLQLVGIEPVDFVESSFLAVDLLGLSSDVNVAALKSLYFADIIILITGNVYTPDIFGIANIGGVNSSGTMGQGFGIVKIGFAHGFTFAHEVGHVFGARHQNCQNSVQEILTTCDPAATTQSQHGHKFKVGLVPFLKKKRRTVMFTPRKDTQVPYFSNPDVTYWGGKTGIQNERNNANMIKSSACTVADFFTGGDVSLYMNIIPSSGSGFSACPCESLGLTADANGGSPGAYSYEWKTSNDGFNWGSIQSTQSSYAVVLSCTAGIQTHVWLRVTDVSGEFKDDFQIVTPVMVDGCPIERADNKDKNSLVEQKSRLNLKVEIESFYSLFPNPASGYLKMELNLKEKQNIHIDLYNNFNVNVKKLIKESVLEGQHTMMFNLDGFPSGIYYLHIGIGELKNIEKLTILN